MTFWPNAIQEARRCFGWGKEDIYDAMRELRPQQFHKIMRSDREFGLMLDVYKARGLKGENVYIHFYIDQAGEDTLVISSFKRI